MIHLSIKITPRKIKHKKQKTIVIVKVKKKRSAVTVELPNNGQSCFFSVSLNTAIFFSCLFNVTGRKKKIGKERFHWKELC